MISQVFFILLLIIGFGLFAWNIQFIRQNIKLGKDLDRSDQKSKRLKTMLLVAFGQQKMFQRILPAIFHLFIYLAFFYRRVL